MGTTYTLSASLGDVIDGGVSSVHAAYLQTNLPDGQALIDTTATSGGIKPSNVGRIPLSGASFTITLLGTANTGLNVAPNTLRYRVVVEYGKPGMKGLKTWESVWFPLTADSDLKTVVGTLELVAPSTIADLLGARIDGVEDHGNVSGALELDSDISTHWLDATGPTTITISDGPAGEATRYVTVLPISGAEDITFVEPSDATLTDGAFATFAWVRGSWILAGAGASSGGGAPVDDTPPTAPSALDATGGEGEVTVTYTAGTDPDSSSTTRYEIYLTSEGTAGTSTLAPASPFTIEDLPAGAYTVRMFTRNAANLNSSVVTDTFTVTAAPGWSLFDSLGPTQIGADGARSVTTDFTTVGGRTYRTGSYTSEPMSVVGGRIKAPSAQADTFFFGGSGPTGYVAREFDYAALAFNSGEFASAEFYVSQQYGNAGAKLESAYTTGFEYRARITSTFSSSTMVCTAGPGYTLASDGKSVVGIPQSGHVRVEPDGQLLNLYIDDALVITGDFTDALDSGSGNPNPLTGNTSSGAALFNGIEIGNLTWETYA